MNVATTIVSKEEKKIYVPIEDKSIEGDESDEETKVPLKLQKTNIEVISKYGDGFIFSKTSRAANWTDSRDGEQVSEAFMLKEISRIVSPEQAEATRKQIQEVEAE